MPAERSDWERYGSPLDVLCTLLRAETFINEASSSRGLRQGLRQSNAGPAAAKVTCLVAIVY